MSVHVPVEILDTLLIVLLGMVWNGYRRVWRHIRTLETAMVKVMLMLQMHGLQVPDERDTEVFRRANNFDGV